MLLALQIPLRKRDVTPFFPLHTNKDRVAFQPSWNRKVASRPRCVPTEHQVQRGAPCKTCGLCSPPALLNAGLQALTPLMQLQRGLVFFSVGFCSSPLLPQTWWCPTMHSLQKKNCRSEVIMVTAILMWFQTHRSLLWGRPNLSGIASSRTVSHINMYIKYWKYTVCETAKFHWTEARSNNCASQTQQNSWAPNVNN